MMSRKCTRLVACLSMVAFLFGNTHAGLAIQAHLRANALATTKTSDPSAVTQVQEENTSVTSKCKHCAKRNLDPVENDSKRPEDQGTNSSSVCTVCVGEPGDSCPCCPTGPSGPTCPSPGGCALCNPAKAFCDVPITSNLPFSFCFGEVTPEEAFPYVPPFCEGLIRPPRI